MNVGTKSVLFGVHQFLIHPFLVFIAWYKFYGKLPNYKECICIFFHDIGYFGKPNMDGVEGELHPELGGDIVNYILGKEYSELTQYHSRSYAKKCYKNTSKLCIPDKLSILLYPKWLYLMLGTLSGEINEYKYRMGMISISNEEWLIEVRTHAYYWAYWNSTYNQQFSMSQQFFNSNIRSIAISISTNIKSVVV